MEATEKRCPKCNNTLHTAQIKNNTFYACKCGHAETTQTKTIPKGTITYKQKNGHKNITATYKKEY